MEHHFTAGRFRPASPPCRAHSLRQSSTSPAKWSFHREQEEPTPESTPMARSPLSPSTPPSPPPTFIALSIALSPLPSASFHSNPRPPASTLVTPPSPRPMSIESSPPVPTLLRCAPIQTRPASALPCSRLTFGTAPCALDLAALQNAADHVIGTHDFTSFAAVDPELNARDASSGSTSAHHQHPHHPLLPVESSRRPARI